MIYLFVYMIILWMFFFGLIKFCDCYDAHRDAFIKADKLPNYLKYPIKAVKWVFAPEPPNNYDKFNQDFWNK